MATQAIFQEQHSALNRAVRSWDRRLRAQQTLGWLPRSLMPGLVLGIVLAVISRLRPFLLPGQIALVGAVGVIVGMVVMLAVVWLWPRPALAAARRFDLMFGLNERVSTALELIDGRIQSNEELASRQVNDAWQRVTSVRAKDSLPFSTSPREWGAAVVLALVLAALVLLPNPRADEVAANEAQQAAIDEAAEDLREVTEDIATDPNLDDAERESLLQALDRGIETLEREDVSPEEAFATLSDVQSALQERANLFNQQLNDSSTAMERAAEALGDFQSQDEQEQQEQEQTALEQAMQEMMQQMGGMNAQQQQSAAQAMQQAADARQNSNPQAAQQMQQASQQMQQGQTGQAQQSMEQAQQSVQQQQQAQQGQQQSAQQMQQSANQVGQSAQQVAQSGQQQQAQQGGQQQQGQQQGGQPQGQPQTGQQQGQQQGQQGGQMQQAGQQGQQGQQGAPQEGQQGGSQEGQEGMQGAAGQQQGEENGQPQESGSGGGAGDGEGDAGSDASGGQSGQPPGQGNNPDGEGESEYAPVFSPRQIGGELGEDEIILEPDGSSAPVVEGEFAQNPNGQSQVPYNQVYDSYVGDVNRALDSDYIPLGLRDVVRDYFSSLEPGQNGN